MNWNRIEWQDTHKATWSVLSDNICVEPNRNPVHCGILHPNLAVEWLNVNSIRIVGLGEVEK